jgi:WD40 repeat protein
MILMGRKAPRRKILLFKMGSMGSTLGKKKEAVKLTPIPIQDRPNPYLTSSFDPFPTKNLQMSKNFEGHMMAISTMAIHPRKPFLATASDDLTWKIWSIPNGELIMSGEGHKDWVSGIDFHPKGSHLATCSGDSTIKIWDFLSINCAQTFKDHIHPVWSVAFHDTGDFLVSGSMDHSAKLFDIGNKARNTFR